MDVSCHLPPAIPSESVLADESGPFFSTKRGQIRSSMVSYHVEQKKECHLSVRLSSLVSSVLPGKKKAYTALLQ